MLFLESQNHVIFITTLQSDDNDEPDAPKRKTEKRDIIDVLDDDNELEKSIQEIEQSEPTKIKKVSSNLSCRTYCYSKTTAKMSSYLQRSNDGFQTYTRWLQKSIQS